MAFLSNPTASLRFAVAVSGPFASLTAAAAPRRSWLVEFLKTPFQDIDTRASYWLEKKRLEATAAAAGAGHVVGVGD